MVSRAQERELIERFAGEYQRAQTPIMLDLERSVCGCDYGGTSWTTRAEAEHIGRLLGLGEGRDLLEIGSGSGWPALYLARTTDCNATLSDVPREALHIAATRAMGEGLRGRVTLAAASGASLPFAPESFDALSHSDVLCCLERKRDVLNECRRVARREATMVFTVISIAPALGPADYARAVESGPPFIESECEYPRLLAECGWSVEDCIDMTAAYEETGKRHLREVQARADAIRELLGDAEFDDLLVRRHRNVTAVEKRIVLRELFVARLRYELRSG